MEITRRSALILAAGVGLATVPAGSAQAAYYNDYETIARIPNAHGCTAAQGFAAGGTYLYSVKIRSDDARAIIYRTNRTTGATEIMTNGTDGVAYNSWLGHANDMTLATIDGEYYMFIVTMTTEGAQLVKLKYVSSTYYKVGTFAIHLGGTAKAVSGITRTAKTSTSIDFLFKSVLNVYRGSIGLRDDSGTIDITEAFTLDTAGAKVNGEVVPDIEDFTNQGFFYDENVKDLFHPLTKGNRSIVLHYPNITDQTSGAIAPDPELSFRVTSSTYPRLFEIESLGISDGTLYFSTNRSKSASDADWDGVHSFKGFSRS